MIFGENFNINIKSVLNIEYININIEAGQNIL